MRDIKDGHIPYGRQSIDKEDIEAVVKVLKSDFVTQGPVVSKFEEAISKKVGSKYSVAVNSATSALHIACRALDVRPGDWIWTTPITFVASANCGVYCGANIDFVDINPRTGLMDIDILESKLTNADRLGKLPKIIVPVHFAGSSCEMQRIKSLSLKYGFKILEDASHAIGGKYMNEPVGTCKYSDITVFSFHPVKIITTGEGGMCITNNEIYARRMRNLRTHGITKDQDYFLDKNPNPWSYEQQELGFNYRLTDFQAALGISQMKKLDFFVNERNRLWNEYKILINDLPISLLEVPNNVYSALHLCVISLNFFNKKNHQMIFKKLKSEGIGVQVHYIPVHLQPFYKDKGFKNGDLPNAEKFSSNVISIPLYPSLDKRDQNIVVEKLKVIFSEVK